MEQQIVVYGGRGSSDVIAVDVSSTSGRNFTGTVSLEAGYGESRKTFPRSTIIDAWNSWAKNRLTDGAPTLGVIVSGVENIIYALGEGASAQFYSEQVVTVSGEIASQAEHLNDEEVLEILMSLFAHLGIATQQTTVRFLYHGNEGTRCSYRLRFPDKSHPLDNLTGFASVDTIEPDKGDGSTNA